MNEIEHHRPHRRARWRRSSAPTAKRPWLTCATATSRTCAPTVRGQGIRKPASSCAPKKSTRCSPANTSASRSSCCIMLVIFWLTFIGHRRAAAGPAGRLGSTSLTALARPSPSPGCRLNPVACTRSSSTACAPAWAASSPSCRSSCCCSSSSRCWRTAATWPASPLSWISCCARSAFPAAALCRC